MKNFNTSPLPFQGQKRNFIKQFKTVLKEYPNNAIYIDLFGGSGLLSHTVKTELPNSKVIYNDYDNFKQRLDNIPITNKILSELRTLLASVPHKSKLSEFVKQQVLDIVNKYDQNGFVDYVSLSSNLLFSSKYAVSYDKLQKEDFYNKIRKSDYNADEYLNNVEFVSCDYKLLFDKYKDCSNVVFLVDPPYLSTDSTTYKNYWKLSDYLDVLKVLVSNKYIYFTSNKSSVIELCEWIQTNTGGINPFEKAKVNYHYNKTSYNTGYMDVMIHKNWTTDSTI